MATYVQVANIVSEKGKSYKLRITCPANCKKNLKYDLILLELRII